MKKQGIHRTRLLQYVVRFSILGVVTYFAVEHQIHKSAAPNVHAFCPFGGLEALYQFVAAGGYIRKIFPSTMILLGGTILLTILLNRAFCGWICPLGTLQMIPHKIARFFKIKPLKIPQKLDRGLSYLKYGILAIVLYFTWQAGELVYDAYGPWAAYAHLAGGFEELFSKFLIGTIFLLLAVVGSLWIPHNFCRYFCPMGAFLSLVAKLSPTKLYRTASCFTCKKCDRNCPVQIDLCKAPKVKSTECISCGDCLVGCPGKDCLEYRTGGKFPVRWALYGVLALVLFFTPVVIAKQVGAWKTMETARDILSDPSGIPNPYNIKGKVSLAEVAREFQIPLLAFVAHFQLPEVVDPDQRLKDIADTHGLRMRDFKEFAAEYLQERNPGVMFEDTGPMH